MVAKGGFIDNNDYNNAAQRIAALLGNGSGQSGYGQRVPSAENAIPDNAIIEATNWNVLIGDINRVRQHQANNDALSFTFDGVSDVGVDNADIVGADASGTSVTRDNTGEDFVINSPATGQGVNDIISAISTTESAGLVFNGASFTTTAPGTGDFGSTQRFSPWGGTNKTQVITAEVDVIFDGQYTVTNSDGTTETLSGTTNDHRRHFFNTGGEINIKFSLDTPTTNKDSSWQQMFDNFGTLSFRANSTNQVGGSTAGLTQFNDGTNNTVARGNYQLTTAFQQIAFKRADDASSYAENRMAMQAKRVGQNTIRFQIILQDTDTGDTEFDEDVLAGGGDITATIDLKRSTGDIFVPEPTYFEKFSLQQST